MTSKKIIGVVAIAVVICLCFFLWNRLASTTKIGLVNFQQFQTTSFIKSNTDRFIEFEEIPLDGLNRLGRYDFVLAFGMGLNASAEQRAQIQAAADKGTPLLVFAPTNPDNKICSLDSIRQKDIASYLENGNKKNYQNMARYIRQHIDRKTFFVTPADSAVESASDVLYHLDEEVSFPTVAEYETYLKREHYYKEGAPKVAIIGSLNDPFSGNRANLDSLISSLQQDGMNVYPIASNFKRLDFLKEVRPDAVVYFAHGRLAMGQADAAVDWLKAGNIPLFAPLTILSTQEEWAQDPMGMMGGFMSQSIIMPELDGAVYPYVLSTQELDKDGVYVFQAIPERLRHFTQIVHNYVSLKKKANAEKKVAIYYFKGPGQESLTAQGLETVPSLYNVLQRLKAEGYHVDQLPPTEAEFEKLLMKQGAVLSTYAKGAFDDYLSTGHPDLIEKGDYESWIKQAVPEKLYADVVKLYGEAPGEYMQVEKDGKQYLAVARVQLGNIALLPQPMAALGDDAFSILHGAKSAPPHTYIGAYLWAKYAFHADAILHFGTHGSLEFTPQKQVALSSYDWPDRLVGTVPHFYYYTIGNIGESMMAKRRSYATTVSYLTPAFIESETRSQYKSLEDKIETYYKTAENKKDQVSLEVKKIAVQMGLHRDLRLDSLLNKPYSEADIERIENYAEEISNEKINGQLYTTGIPYDREKIHSTILAMSTDPIAYSLATLDKQRGKVTEKQLKSNPFFTRQYREPSERIIEQVLNGQPADTAYICRIAGISPEELAEAAKILAPRRSGMMVAMMAAASSSSDKKEAGHKEMGGHPAGMPKTGKMPEFVKKMLEEKKKEEAAAHPAKDTAAQQKAAPSEPTYTPEQKEKARAITEIARAIQNVTRYKTALEQSPEQEMKRLLNALAGGYTPPSSGGDAVANPNAVPTGCNLYSINAEATPSESAWEKGRELVNATLEQYKKQHDGQYPRKVSYTFWSSEFIESEGATIAQALYMLGVEPVRDAFGRVSDIQLIPAEKLGRPRIDVVIQTSGQFRDLAASRLALISRAVEMAATATDKTADNFVAQSVVDVEQQLVDQGISPKEARELSTKRVFGGINGMYGTGIQEMVTSGDKWENEEEIANVYLNNMGALYGGEKEWGNFRAGLLRAVLKNTDAIVQPRQSNTWGALSLDHVYEFMGGMNLAIRNVTGKDPDAFFADYRNHNNFRMQDLKEAIGVEARSTVFNPTYIKEVMKGGASSASRITEVVTNTYGWNVMKPDVIDNEVWNQLYDVYVKDSYNLGTESFFKKENPAALQEITAVMLETARKGMWKASSQQLQDVAKLHTGLVKEFGARGAGFSGSNAKLQDYIAQNSPADDARAYQQQIRLMKEGASAEASGQSGMVLKKEQVASGDEAKKNSLNGVVIVAVVLILFIILLAVLRKRRKKEE